MHQCYRPGPRRGCQVSAQFRRAAANHDNACDCCGHDDGKAYELRGKLLEGPRFIAEAIGNADLANLIEAYLSGDLQHTHDAIADIVSDYLPGQENSEGVRLKGPWHHSPSDVEVLQRMCKLYGVAA